MAQDDSARDAAMARRVARAEAAISEGGLGKYLERLHPRNRRGKWRDSMHAAEIDAETRDHARAGRMESKYDMPGKRRAAAGPSKHEVRPARNPKFDESSKGLMRPSGGWPAIRPINHSAEVKDDSGTRIGRAVQARGKGSKGWLAHHHTKGNVGTFEGKVEAENAVRAAHKSGKPDLPPRELEQHMAAARAHEGFKPETPVQKRVAKRIAAQKAAAQVPDPSKMTTAELSQAYENARGSSPSDLSGLSGEALQRARAHLNVKSERFAAAMELAASEGLSGEEQRARAQSFVDTYEKNRETHPHLNPPEKILAAKKARAKAQGDRFDEIQARKAANPAGSWAPPRGRRK